MRYCPEDAPRTGERNVNLDKNTSESAALNNIINKVASSGINLIFFTVTLYSCKGKRGRRYHVS